MAKIKLLLGLIFFFFCNYLAGQNRSEVWTRLSLYSENLIPKTKITFEGQYRVQYQTRFTSSDLNTYTFRIWIVGDLGAAGFYYQSSPIAVFYRKSVDGATDFESTEIRLTQLAGYKLKSLPLEFRSGLEWRNFHQENNLSQEWRWRTKAQVLLRHKKEIQPIFAAEYFYRFSSRERQIDQLRLLGGIRGNYKKIELELGYQYHIRNQKENRVNSQVIYLNLTPKI